MSYEIRNSLPGKPREIEAPDEEPAEAPQIPETPAPSPSEPLVPA